LVDDARWIRIDALFDAALELPEDRRRELLDRECADDPELRRAVERLLVLEAEAGGFLAEPVLGHLSAARESAPPDPEALAPTCEELSGIRIGAYRLVHSLGHGGMGTVYLARREDDYHHEVAIKLVRRSLLSHEARRRLHAERQALAGLEHPNIARLYDGGTTDDGLPYLVMERVEGLPIDRYCERHGLGVRQRLELVRQVLAAVAHAHDHLRVHCDIKPSNILVTEDGTPKLLDFGIAKLLSAGERAQIAVTATGLRPLTPAYASPEQILGEPITIASDLYSVGVLLYELLCGSLPYGDDGAAGAELRRSIVEQDPAPPSRNGRGRGGLERRLRGDLDAIVLMAIRKDPAHRYPSARAFVTDITRHLEARPVRARRGTLRYRAGRFLRRLVLPPNLQHRWERWAWAGVLAAVTGLSLLTLRLQRPPSPVRTSRSDSGGSGASPGAPPSGTPSSPPICSPQPTASIEWPRLWTATHGPGGPSTPRSARRP
jgi:serine/threonine protein kinase